MPARPVTEDAPFDRLISFIEKMNAEQHPVREFLRGQLGDPASSER